MPRKSNDMLVFGAPPPGGRKVTTLLLSFLTCFPLSGTLLTPAVILCNIHTTRVHNFLLADCGYFRYSMGGRLHYEGNAVFERFSGRTWFDLGRGTCCGTGVVVGAE